MKKKLFFLCTIALLGSFPSLLMAMTWDEVVKLRKHTWMAPVLPEPDVVTQNELNEHLDQWNKWSTDCQAYVEKNGRALTQNADQVLQLKEDCRAVSNAAQSILKEKFETMEKMKKKKEEQSQREGVQRHWQSLEDIRVRYQWMFPLPSEGPSAATLPEWDKWIVQQCLGSNPTERMIQGCREVDNQLSALFSGRARVISPSLTASPPRVVTPVEEDRQKSPTSSGPATALERMWDQVNQSYRMDWMPELNVRRYRDLHGHYNNVVTDSVISTNKFAFKIQWEHWTATCKQAASVLGDRERAVAKTAGVDLKTIEERAQAAVKAGIQQCEDIGKFAKLAGQAEEANPTPPLTD